MDRRLRITFLRSEEARIKRRTIHTQDIGAHNIDLDGDGMPDNF